MLSEVDLPPVSGVELPWAGTQPERAADNMAATRCDNAAFNGEFQGAKFAHAFTRTFVIPDAELPDEFGLTETVGSLPAKQAAGFVEEVRKSLGGCARRDLGTDVTLGPRTDDDDRALTIWHLTTELSDKAFADLLHGDHAQRHVRGTAQLRGGAGRDHGTRGLRDPRLPRPRPARRAAVAPPVGLTQLRNFSRPSMQPASPARA